MTLSIVLQFVVVLAAIWIGARYSGVGLGLSGTTKIGKYVLNHSFMIPGVVATAVAVITGLFLARIMF